MIITNKEKKDLAIELIKQGCPQRQIAKQVHLSFKTIGEIRKEVEGNIGTDYKNKKQQLSVSSQAFILFEQNKSLVQVDIDLDLPTDEVLKIHSEYLILTNRQKIDFILKENDDNLKFHKVMDLLKENKININDITPKIILKSDFDNLKLEYDKLELECFCQEESVKYWKSEFYILNDKYKKLKGRISFNFL